MQVANKNNSASELKSLASESLGVVINFQSFRKVLSELSTSMKRLTDSFILIINCIICALLYTNAQEHVTPYCGILDERFLYDKDDTTLPTETPFLGTILYTSEDGDTLTSECLATLIDNRHLLAPAFCFENSNKPLKFTKFRIQLGAFKQTSDTKKYNCNSVGFCIPPPREYQVEEVKIHPYWDPITLANNIAIITLRDRVTFTPHIQPVCLEAQSKYKSIIARQFEMVGVTFKYPLRMKTSIFIISRRYYDRKYANIFSYIDTQFSGTQTSEDIFYSGSVVLGIHMNGEQPDHFYIVGILLKSGSKPHTPIINVFQGVQPYLDWINSHISHGMTTYKRNQRPEFRFDLDNDFKIISSEAASLDTFSTSSSTTSRSSIWRQAVSSTSTPLELEGSHEVPSIWLRSNNIPSSTVRGPVTSTDSNVVTTKTTVPTPHPLTHSLIFSH